MKAGALKKTETHQWEVEENEHYAEPRWCSTVLFAHEQFGDFIHDPFCGWGRIPEEARRAGYRGVTGSDIVDRGFAGTGLENFLDTTERHTHLVFNPPFSEAEAMIRHACNVANGKVAAILETRKLAAAHWMAELPRSQLWYLTPRPSMPPGRVTEELAISLGKEPSGGTKDFCWVVFDTRMIMPPGGRYPSPPWGWLHRDRGRIG